LDLNESQRNRNNVAGAGLRSRALQREDEEHSRQEDEKPNDRKGIPPGIACHDRPPFAKGPEAIIED
jgi:hypothetical protein